MIYLIKEEIERWRFLMKISRQDVRNLSEIHRKFSEIESLYQELSQEVKQVILEMHGEHFTVAHCSRWGEMAINDVRDELEVND